MTTVKPFAIVNEPSDPITNKTRPTIYNEEEWRKKEHDYPWLICVNGKLGCSFCQKAKHLSVLKNQGVHMASEWLNNEIGKFISLYCM